MRSCHRYHRQGLKQTNKAKKRRTKTAPKDKLKHLKAKHQKPKVVDATLSIKDMDKLNDYIHEYLIFHGYDKTIYEFEKERISNSYTQIKLEHNLVNTNIVNNDEMRNEILQKIIMMFDANDINGIFKLWNRYISKQVLNTNAYAIKIECHLHIFKFVIKINKNCIQNLNAIRSELQSYFNDNGARLALCQDVLPYFSLPFVENAQNHPIFYQFYEPRFAHNLRSQLTGFMLKSIDNINVPKLHSVFAISQKINIDYYLTKMLRITSDFVSSMQYCLNNNLPPTSTMIGTCKQKMAILAGDILNERNFKHNYKVQVTDSNGDVPCVEYDEDDNQHQLIQPKKINTNNIKENIICLNIDYDKLQKDLCVNNCNQSKLLLLLQSLRWRITKLIKHKEKRRIVVEYICNDIFECKNIKMISNLLKHSNIQIVETSLRLLNVVSSFAIGRTYLLKMDELINILCDILTSSDNDDSMRMNCLGVLQKLSLRKELQDKMIADGLIGFLIEMLQSEELNELSQYTVEYSTALLMNLTLRSKGKKQCQLNAQHINKILNTLLNLLNSSFVAQIHTYVNGVLYSLVSEKCVLETALKFDLKNKLNQCSYNDPSFKQQIDYIISVLSSPLQEHDLMNLDKDSDESSNEDYSENEDYQEYDVNELAEYLGDQNNYVQGDQFLFNEYQNVQPLKVMERPSIPVSNILPNEKKDCSNIKQDKNQK